MTGGEKLLADCGFTLFIERHGEHANIFNYRHNNEYVSFYRYLDNVYDVIAWEEDKAEQFIPLVCSENLIKAIDARLRELNAEENSETGRI